MPRNSNQNDQTADYIIIGGGSAGCVLANRLSANPANSVILLEAGGDNRNFMVQLPKGMAKLVTNPKFTWDYPVLPERANGTVVKESWQRGRGLGGSSAINGMIWTRGQPEDYHHWENEAGSEWGWDSMKKTFRLLEDHELGDDGLRGTNGPVHITTNKFRYPMAERAIEAGVQMGLERREDLNRENQEGVGYYSYNIKNGRRQSAAVCFLDPVRDRKNLQIITDVYADRVLFEGKRAAAVDCRIAGKKVTFRANKEIIISCGAIGSPKLLQLSGIGPAKLLQDHGIEVVCDSPDVGRRFREHLGLMMSYRLQGDRGVNHRLNGLGLAASVIQYVTTHTGPLANGFIEVGAFVRTSPAEPRPNAQIYISAWSLDVPQDSNVAVPVQSVEREPGLTVSAQLVGTDSEGSIEISSSDPDAPLTITPNWLTTEHDRRQLIDFVRYIRTWLTQPAIWSFIKDELRPGFAVASDEQILDYMFANVSCGTHGVGSCRMGRDPDSVVDERLRVRGVSGLRVVDCSVMPGHISGNTNGPAMATGWRAAELIMQDARMRNAA